MSMSSSLIQEGDSGQSVQMTDDEKEGRKKKRHKTFLDTVSADPDKDMNAAAASAEKKCRRRHLILSPAH